jgi:hypothetical protein
MTRSWNNWVTGGRSANCSYRIVVASSEATACVVRDAPGCVELAGRSHHRRAAPPAGAPPRRGAALAAWLTQDLDAR